ncbi:TonB-dependent receptor [Sphingomonas metalli]|uniref:TonB-dependent receptor n=2 Tax=Sphingomonas metalli TaxID=1779358 RepID=A0A916WS74_9SPHN|nr:TonB-dependent receptor [Sphingomonas metalli]
MRAGCGRQRRKAVGGLVLPFAILAAPEDASAEPPREPTPAAEAGDIVVTGERVRGSAIGDVQPLAVLGAQALEALGATSMKELLQRLKPFTAAGGGGDPFLLLNGRRISGWDELSDLPPEAMEKTEVLPREDAARFGFPPTATVLNFITKKHFRAVAAQFLPGITTEGGGGTDYTEMNATRLDGDRRLSLNTSYVRTSPVTQAQRQITPDPGFLFATGGNVTGLNGGSIDPALDALAGRPVTVAALPATAAERATLTAYLPGANRPAVTDPGAGRWLVQASDQIRSSGTLAGPVAGGISGSLNLTMEAQGTRGRNGPAPVLLTVPGGGDVLPFAGDTRVYRALPDAVLRQRNTSLTLHGGGALFGAIGRWAWNVTASHDRTRAESLSEQGIVDSGLQAAVRAGGDPLRPLDAAMLASRRVLRGETLTRTLTGKATANGPLLRLPAGMAQVTVTADYAASASSGVQPGLAASRLALSRTTRGASINATLPIAERERDVLAPVGTMTATAMLGVSDVSDYGRLVTANYGLTWSRWSPVQVNLSVNTTQTAPAIAQLTNPVLTSPNTPFFDFTTGTTSLVTSVSGGNPALAPERRRVTTAGVALRPFAHRDLRLNIDYAATRVSDLSAELSGLTAAAQAAFPDIFTRDAAGRLVAVDFRSVNIAREDDRQIRATVNFSTPLGPKPSTPAATPGVKTADAPPPRPPKQRPSFYTFATTTLRLEDRLLLRPGIPLIDLLDGATLNGTGGRPRWEVEGTVGLSYGPTSTNFYARVQGSTRVRSDLASADLHFSGRTWLVLWESVDVAKLVSRPWAQRMSVQFTVENLLNDRIDVVDRNGATPYRFQPAYLDPMGRSVRLGLRKLF